VSELVDPLMSDVISPFMSRLVGRDVERATVAVERWRTGKDEWLRRAASAVSSR